MRWLLATVGLTLVLCIAHPLPAFAHAILVESTPAVGASIPAGDTPFRLRFNSRIDRARSRLILIRPDHSTSVVPIDDQGSDDVLIGHVALPAGSFVLRWQVLAVDGHITRGDVPLIVRPAGS